MEKPIFPTRRFLSFAGSLLLAGCAGSSDGPGAAKSARLDVPPPAAAVIYTIPSGSGPDALARLAILHHPSLTAARHRAERLAQKAPQERSLPDPMLEIAAGSMAETAAGRTAAMGGVKQKIPFPGKRRGGRSKQTPTAIRCHRWFTTRRKKPTSHSSLPKNSIPKEPENR